MKKIIPENLPERVADGIAEMIINRKYEPGERLIEMKLATDLGVSQGTIRQALRILEKKNMVTILPRRGTTVTRIDASYVDSLYDVLSELYVMMMRKAVARMSPADREDIVRTVQILRKRATEKDDVQYGKVLSDTLQKFMRIANDPILEHIIMDLWQFSTWTKYEALMYKKGHVEDYAEIAILDAALTGNADKACTKVSEYLRKLRIIAKKTIARKADHGSPAERGPERIQKMRD